MCLRSNFTLGNMAVRSTPEERHVLQIPQGEGAMAGSAWPV